MLITFLLPHKLQSALKRRDTNIKSKFHNHWKKKKKMQKKLSGASLFFVLILSVSLPISLSHTQA